MARRHGQDRGGEQDCGYAASLGQRKRVAHIPTADAKAAGSCLILKDKGRRDYTLTPAPPGPTYGVHFTPPREPPVNASTAWAGTWWSGDEQTITIRPKPDGRIVIKGVATWGGHDPER